MERLTRVTRARVLERFKTLKEARAATGVSWPTFTKALAGGSVSRSTSNAFMAAMDARPEDGCDDGEMMKSTFLGRPLNVVLASTGRTLAQLARQSGCSQDVLQRINYGNVVSVYRANAVLAGLTRLGIEEKPAITCGPFSLAVLRARIETYAEIDKVIEWFDDELFKIPVEERHHLGQAGMKIGALYNSLFPLSLTWVLEWLNENGPQAALDRLPFWD